MPTASPMSTVGPGHNMSTMSYMSTSATDPQHIPIATQSDVQAMRAAQTPTRQVKLRGPKPKFGCDADGVMNCMGMRGSAPKNEGPVEHTWRCDRCQKVLPVADHHCPQCGARRPDALQQVIRLRGENGHPDQQLVVMVNPSGGQEIIDPYPMPPAPPLPQAPFIAQQGPLQEDRWHQASHPPPQDQLQAFATAQPQAASHHHEQPSHGHVAESAVPTTMPVLTLEHVPERRSLDHQLQGAQDGLDPIDRIRGVLYNSSVNIHETERACRDLALLSESPDMHDKVLSKIGVHGITDTMVREPHSLEVQSNCCKSLHMLVEPREHFQNEVVAKGGIDIVVKAMQQFHADPVFTTHSMSLMHDLSMHEDGRRKMASRGAVMVMVSMMQSHPRNASVQEAGCSVLGNMAFEEDCRTQIGTEQCITTVLEAMRNYPKDKPLHESGGFLIHNLTCDLDLARKVKNHGGDQILQESLRLHPADANEDDRLEALQYLQEL